MTGKRWTYFVIVLLSVPLGRWAEAATIPSPNPMDIYCGLEKLGTLEITKYEAQTNANGTVGAGMPCVELDAIVGAHGQMVALRGTEIELVPLARAVATLKTVPPRRMAETGAFTG